eukprot:gene19955-26663_t
MTSGKAVRALARGIIGAFGMNRVSDISQIPLEQIKSVTKALARGIIGSFGMNKLSDISHILLEQIKTATKAGPEHVPEGNPQRAIFCSRTMNMRSIKAIGYDMDYTLIHYDVNAWEGRAYEYGLEDLKKMVRDMKFSKFNSSMYT